jgi:PAS domain-containing protein
LVTATSEPLVLRHSWPLYEQARHFDLGCILNCAVTDILRPATVGQIGLHHAGLWECDLTDNRLVWSGGVYDIFGLERGSAVTRDEAVGFYSEPSRAAMERLRAYAIRHKRGFTIDAEICPPASDSRWMRLIAAPVCVGDRVVSLRGLKLII